MTKHTTSLEASSNEIAWNGTETYAVATNSEEAPLHCPIHVLFAGESQTKPLHKQGPKFYDFYLLHIVASGQGRFVTERGTYHLSTGDVFLIRPHELIEYESDNVTPWSYHWIAFKSEYVHSLIEQTSFASQTDIVRAQQLDHVVAQWQNIFHCFKQHQANPNLQAMGHLYVLLALLHQDFPSERSHYKTSSVEHPVVKQIVHYLATQFSSPISLASMSDTLGYNRAYLSRVFKQQLGISPRTYLLHYRLDRAKYLLKTRRHFTIEQISASVGIQDALYFSKQFKRYTSVSPSQYRTRQHS